ncbi:MAG: hypothetical protein F4Y79_08035 [Gemmatimonadetes bacterium]|nr:hypothetical protein [Gemmatimonadota bacterium]MYF17248.1 hypothetical protein [Gemmatimonadota bacterium]
MNGSNFGVAVKKWQFKVLRNCVLLMMTVIAFGQADAGLIPETPTPQGGEIVGSWVAEKVGLDAYVPAGLVQAVSPLTVEGEINGTITFGSDGSVKSDYTTLTNVSAVLLVPLTVAVHDTSRYEGNYTVASDTHALTITLENEDPLNYTYTATADSLKIIRPLLLDELLQSLSEAVRPLAMSALSQHVPPDDPIRIVITFAKMKDTGTPPPTPPPTPPTMLTGDFDGNGTVEFPDFLLFVAQFGKSSSDDGFNASMDLDSSGTIDFPDFLLFVAAFGSKSG